jgi:hypothetical protein
MRAIEAMRPILRPEDAARMHRQYMEDIQPLLRMRAAIYSCAKFQIILGDGLSEHRYLLADDVQKAVDLIDEAIRLAIPSQLRSDCQ